MVRKTIRRFSRAEDFVDLETHIPARVPSDIHLSMVPRQLFQTAADCTVHRLHKEAIQDFQRLNDDLSFHLFTDVTMDEYMNDVWAGEAVLEIYNRSLIPQMKADIFRYCIIFERGGYYLDINKSINGRITNLHDASDSGLISFESNISTVAPDPSLRRLLSHPTNMVLQWGFGFSPHHPVLAATIEGIVEARPMFEGLVGKVPHAVVAFTGPGAFTRGVWDYFASDGNMSLHQAGIDFYGRGVFRVKGSNLSRKPVTHYTSISQGQLLATAT